MLFCGLLNPPFGLGIMHIIFTRAGGGGFSVAAQGLGMDYELTSCILKFMD